MRVVLGGIGDPIPDEALPAPGVDANLPPRLFSFTDDATFDKTDWAGLGYTNIEIWCIGAAGGAGGDGESTNAGTQDYMTSYGGAGGGGGLHHVQALLGDLPTLSSVVVGKAGAKGAAGHTHLNELSNPIWDFPGDGGDGGASIFAGGVAKASGGKGGKGTGSHQFEATNGDIPRIKNGGAGGDGGAGNRTVAGGGALGSAVDRTSQTVPEVNGSDGDWDGTIGKGGGGGQGGTYSESATHLAGGPHIATFKASSGGGGSFSFADPGVYVPGQSRAASPGNYIIIPGAGGGAKITSIYGSRVGGSPDGVVIIRLTKVA